MKDANKECIYGGFECPCEYDKYEKQIDIKRWIKNHRSMVFFSIPAVALTVIILLIFLLTAL